VKLRRVEIENFRGIRKLAMDLDDLVVLIGENNTGKTAILHALKLCLRDLGPRRRVVFDPFDFHLKDDASEPNGADPISVTVTFGEATANEWDTARQRRLKYIVQVDPNSGLSLVTLRVTCSYSAPERDFAQNWEFLNPQGQPLQDKGEQALGALQREVAFYLLDALRDAGKNFDPKGPFWRPFLKDGQLPADKKEEIERKLSELNELVVSSHGTFEKALERLKKVQDVVSMQAGDVVSIEAVPGRIFDMLAKAQVHLGTMTGAKVPVGRHGEGTQSLAVLMLFAAFLDLSANGSDKDRVPLVALEEPEAHLHPSAVRTLWKTVERVPGQKLISTHSGDLLSQVPVSVVRRLARTANGVESFQLKAETLDANEQRMFDFHIRHARGELLFARCWLLGEGETEVTLFHEIARHLGIDLERAGVRCIPYRMGASIELFLKVARDFGIRCCALTDNDKQGKADQEHLHHYTPVADQAKAIHVMQEDDVEGHLCTAGFGEIYQAYLTTQTQARVTVQKGHPEYWKQVLTAIKSARDFKKPSAALEVVRLIQSGTKPVPQLIQTAIQEAVSLAGGL
jgi:putative ATP-dependent endonuclease of OLD family